MGKALIVIGITLVIAGLLSLAKTPFSFFGNLPGDVTITGDNYRIYLPFTTCLLISLILSVLLKLVYK